MFGERLKTLRLACGLTQRELSELIGENNKTLAGWENQVSRPGYTAICKLALVLSVPVEELQYGKFGVHLQRVMREQAIPGIAGLAYLLKTVAIEQVERWVLGSAMPSEDEEQQVCALLKVTPAELYGAALRQETQPEIDKRLLKLCRSIQELPGSDRQDVIDMLTLLVAQKQAKA